METSYTTIHKQSAGDAENTNKPPAKIRQSKTFRDIAKRQKRAFDQDLSNRDRAYSFLRERNIIEFVSDSQAMYNNYKRKPEWKETWQSNISDINPHAKLMGLVASTMASRRQTFYRPRRSRDMVSKIKASIFQSIKDYIDHSERNVDIDDMMALLLAMRDGTTHAFLGFKDKGYEKCIDFKFLSIADVVPGNIREFEIRDQNRLHIRSVQQIDRFRQAHQKGPFVDIDKVMPAKYLQDNYKTYFDISGDVTGDRVEKIITFDPTNNEFTIQANGTVITKPGTKLTDIQEDRRIPILKTVFEIFDPKFYYGRSLMDLMKDSYDGVNFLFDSIFDRTLLSNMRPIIVGGPNDLADDFWTPGGTKQVMDVTQVKELGFDGVDMNAFRVLRELQDRNVLASIDNPQLGVASGRKTATEVERAEQAQRIKTALQNVLFGEWQLNKARLMARIIHREYLKNDRFEPFVIENTKLSDGTMGTRIIEVTNELPKRTAFGFAPQLAQQAALSTEPVELLKVTEKEMKDFEIDVSIELEPPTSPLIRNARIRDYVNARLPIALQRPDLLNAESLLQQEADATDGVDWDTVKGEKPQQNPEQQLMEQLAQGQGQGGPALPSLQTLQQGMAGPPTSPL